MVRAEHQVPFGCQAVRHGRQEPARVHVRHPADGVDQVVDGVDPVVGSRFLQMGDGVGAHQAEAGRARLAGEGTPVLGLGGVHGGDLGAQGRPGGVPVEPAAEVEHAQPCHLADGYDAGPRVDLYDAGPWLAETESPRGLLRHALPRPLRRRTDELGPCTDDMGCRSAEPGPRPRTVVRRMRRVQQRAGGARPRPPLSRVAAGGGARAHGIAEPRSDVRVGTVRYPGGRAGA